MHHNHKKITLSSHITYVQYNNRGKSTIGHLEEQRLSHDNIVELFENDRHHFLEIRYFDVHYVERLNLYFIRRNLNEYKKRSYW